MVTPNVQIPETQKASKIQPVQKGNPDTGALFAIVFMLCLEAVGNRQDTVLTQSKNLECNAHEQDKANHALESIPYSQIPKGAATATIDEVQDKNQHYEEERQDIENSLITLRQNSQVMMTQTSTNVNTLQQDASMLSYEIKCQNNIVMALNQMTQR